MIIYSIWLIINERLVIDKFVEQLKIDGALEAAAAATG